VAFDAGVLRGGYVGELGRTTQVGEASGPASALDRRREELLGHLLEACRPGAPLSTLLDAYAKAGEPLPPMPIARGLGLGYDLPLATHELPLLAQEQQLEEGMVLAVIAYLWEEGVGGMYHQEPVVLTASGPELLTANTGLERRESTT
jgi:Xaa-Pro aminopeptidase